MPVIANFLAFQLGWFSCVLGAAHGIPWFGTIIAIALVAWHLARATAPRSELRLILTAGLIGLALDSIPVASGLIHYVSGTLLPGAAPHWIVAMWLIFATTLNVTFRWLKRRWLLAALLGAVAGPLAYYGGAALGAAEFPGSDPALALAVIAIVWASAMPLLMWLSDRYDGMVTA